MPVEPEEKKDVPSTETRCQSHPEGGGNNNDGSSVSEEGPREPSKSPRDSSSTSSSPESDLELGGRCRNKELYLRLSPDRTLNPKRCIWKVDRKEVEESLSRELKRIRQEETEEKSAKYNYNFSEEKPLSGPFKWEVAQDPPDFYKTKIYSGKKFSQIPPSPYKKPTKKLLREEVSSTAGTSASTSTSSAPSSSSCLVTPSIKMLVSPSSVSSSSSVTKEFEQPPSVVIPSEISAEGKEKSLKDSLSLAVASSTVGSSSSFGDDGSTTLSTPTTSSTRQEILKLEQSTSTAKVDPQEDTPTLSTCTSSISVSSNVSVSSSSESSKTVVSSDSSSSSNSKSNNNNGQNVSDINKTVDSNSGSGTISGIVTSQFYSVQSDLPGGEGTAVPHSSSDPSTTKDKSKLPPGKPPPKPPTSGESSSSHLLKYYR